MKGSLKDLNEIPPCGLVDKFAANIETVPETLHETFLEGLRQRLPRRSLNQDQYPDLNQKKEQKPSALRAEALKESSESASPSHDARLIRIAKEVVTEWSKQDVDYQVDVFLQACRRDQIEPLPKRTAVINAIGAARRIA